LSARSSLRLSLVSTSARRLAKPGGVLKCLEPRWFEPNGPVY
jgi:hypothetical protein